MDSAVAVVRGFNRAYTQRIGALSTACLGAGLPLGAAGVLFEFGSGVVGVRELREWLGLDSGYLSRLLRELEDGGLGTVRADRGGRRGPPAGRAGRGGGGG